MWPDPSPKEFATLNAVVEVPAWDLTTEAKRQAVMKEVWQKYPWGASPLCGVLITRTWAALEYARRDEREREEWETKRRACAALEQLSLG